MGATVRAPSSRGAAFARAATGAPRATIALCLVVTLGLGSLVPSLTVDSSEAMWLPQGPRADAYRAMAQSMGSSEYVGVLATPSSGSAVAAANLQALLQLEQRALSDASIAGALRFPGDPDLSMVSIADIAARAAALLEARRATFGPLAAALSGSLAALDERGGARAVAQAALFAAIIVAAQEEPAAAHRLVDRLVAELEVIAQAGEAAPFKAAAAELMGVLADFAQWSRERGPVDPADEAVAALRGLVLAAVTAANSNASAGGRAQGLLALEGSLSAARFGLGLTNDEARQVQDWGTPLSAGFGAAVNDSAASEYALALATLFDARLASEPKPSLGDPEAVAGLHEAALDVQLALGASGTVASREGTARIFGRIFETAVAMGGAGFDLSTPQGNVSYNALTAALEENATLLYTQGLNVSTKAAAAADIQLRIAGVIANNLALNESGVFTCQPCFARQMTMLQSLNASLTDLVGVLQEPASLQALDPAAGIVALEILRVVNVIAPAPHHIDLEMAASLAEAMGRLERAVGGSGYGPSALGFERAIGAALAAFDFESAGAPSAGLDSVMREAAGVLGRFAGLLAGGEPADAKASVKAQAASSFRLPGLVSSSALPNEPFRELLVLFSRAAQALVALEAGDQNPALFARWAGVFGAAAGDGLASPDGLLNGTDAAFVGPLAGLVTASRDLFAWPTLTTQGKLAVENETLAGTALVASRVTYPAAGVARENRTAAAQRLSRLGDGAINESLRVVLVPGARASALPEGLTANNSRLTPFVDNVSVFGSDLEQQLRDAYGTQARLLLPLDLTISGDGVYARSTVLLVLFDGTLERSTLGQREDTLRQLVGSAQSASMRLEPFGYGLMWLDTQRAMDLTVVLFSLSMLAVMAAALWVTYRRLFDTAITVLLLLFTVVWVLGVASLVGISVNPITVIVPVLLIGLAEDYAVHVTMGYRRRRALGARPGRAARGAVKAVGGVLLVATVINGLSFLSFGGAPIALIQNFGVLMALGLGFAFVLSVTWVPAATAWNDRRMEARGPRPGRRIAAPAKAAGGLDSWSARSVHRLASTSMARPYLTAAFVGLVTAASFVAALGIPTTFSYGEVTASQLPVVAAIQGASSSMAGSIDRAYIVVDASADDPAVYLAMAAVEGQVAGDPFVVHVAGIPSVDWIGAMALRQVAEERAQGSGPASPLISAFSALDTNQDGALGPADNLTHAGLQRLFLEMEGRPGSGASQFLGTGTGGLSMTVMIVEVKDAVSHADEIRGALEADLGPLRQTPFAGGLVRATVTGPQLLNQEVMAAVQASGWQSVLVTLCVSALLLAFFFARSLAAPLLGALCVLPTLVAVGWTFGLMALAGLSLNMMTIMIATSTVGIGDLYAIHVAHVHYRALRSGKPPREAKAVMVREAGGPLFEAAATTALGFLVLVASPVPSVRSYGGIFAASIVFAFLFSVVLMPILVRALFVRAGPAARREPPARDEREGEDTQRG